MAKKKEYEYIGTDYPSLKLVYGDIRKLNVKKDSDGGVNIRIWGSPETNRLNLYYRNEDAFTAKWKEVL